MLKNGTDHEKAHSYAPTEVSREVDCCNLALFAGLSAVSSLDAWTAVFDLRVLTIICRKLDKERPKTGR